MSPRKMIVIVVRMAVAALPPPGTRSKIRASRAMIATLRAMRSARAIAVNRKEQSRLARHRDDAHDYRTGERHEREHGQQAVEDGGPGAAAAVHVGEAGEAEDGDTEDRGHA